MSWSSKAGKGGKPLGGVDWGKQYEKSPFLSPLEKRYLKELKEELYNNGEGLPYRELSEDGKGEVEWHILPSYMRKRMRDGDGYGK